MLGPLEMCVIYYTYFLLLSNSFSCLLFFYLGWGKTTDVVHEGEKVVPNLSSLRLSYVGVGDNVGCLRAAWPRWEEKHVFVKDRKSSLYRKSNHPGGVKNVFANGGIDLVVILPGVHLESSGGRFWIKWIKDAPVKHRPPFIIIFLPASCLNDEKGTAIRLLHKTISRLGYSSSTYFARGPNFGSAVSFDSSIHFFSRVGRLPTTMNAFECRQGTARGMANDLVPYPLTPRWCRVTHRQGLQSFPGSGQMPNRIGSVIKTDGGYRKLLKADLARAKGYWREFTTPPGPDSHWELVPPLHLIAAVGDTLVYTRSGDGGSASLSPCPAQPKPLNRRPESERNWTFRMPDLAEGGAWHKQRVKNLRRAAANFGNHKHLVREGLEALRRHRRNYGPEGPKHLQLLWWEWPRRLWQRLLHGFPMHFVGDPPPQDQVTPRNLSAKEKNAMCEYVDELISLGVLVHGKGTSIGRLFTVEKPELDTNGEPLLRVISDLRAGGQNAYMRPEPTHLQKSDDVLPHLFAGGWSMKVDGSKWFYNFPTREEERKFLGAIHPGSGEQYVYRGLPMGASSSPGEAGKGEKCLVNTVLEACSEGYRGHVNHPLNLAAGEPYDPSLGTGIIFMNKLGELLPIIKSHVDDFFLHAKSYESLIKFVEYFLHKAISMGIVFNPLKLEPPSQVTKFCGTVYDTTGIPVRRIPMAKVSRALATIYYTRTLDDEGSLSRLTMAVLIGLLQSLDRCVPYNLVATLLRPLYSDIHADQDVGQVPSDPAYLHRKGGWSRESRLALSIMEVLLLDNRGWRAYPSTVTSMNVCWGDGSGSGMGGTSQSFRGGRTCPVTQWRGTWDFAVNSFTSNWRELRTVLFALQRLVRNKPANEIRDTLCFIFTDNRVSYWILSSGSSKVPKLHELVLEIVLITSHYRIHLEVIWVPGELMIEEGSDGLSRGIWISPCRNSLLSSGHVRAILRAAPHTPAVIRWVRETTNVTRDVHYVNCLRPLCHKKILGRTILVTPPPHVARQIMNSVLCYWVEAPCTTSVFFLLPSIYQHSWGRVNKYIDVIGTFHARDLPFCSLLFSNIPLTLLYLPPFIPSNTTRLDQPARYKPGEFLLDGELPPGRTLGCVRAATGIRAKGHQGGAL